VAVQALTQTITHLTQQGRFRQAADREKEIGQIYLQEMNDLRKACESFERAGEWYAQEDASALVHIPSNKPFSRCVYINLPCRTANACFKDAADLHAELEEYPAAIARYEQVADHSLGSALTKYSVKEYWLRIVLCCLAMKVRRCLTLTKRL
jgi:alpha-soluble NSF attachment protein